MKHNKIVSSSFLNVVGRIVRQLFMLTFTFAISRSLSANEIGIYALTKSVFDIAKQISLAGLQQVILRDAAASYSRKLEKSDQIVVSVLLLVSLNSLVISASLFVFSQEIASYFLSANEAKNAVEIFAIGVCPASISIVLWFTCRAKREFILEIVNVYFTSTFIMSIILGYVYFNVPNLKNYIIVTIGFEFVYLILSIYVAIRYLKINFRMVKVNNYSIYFKFASVVFVIGLLTQISGHAGKWVLSYIGGADSVGVYYIILSLVGITTLFSGSINSIIEPYLSEFTIEKKEGLDKLVQLTQEWTIIIVAPILLYVSVYSENILYIFSKNLTQYSSVLSIYSSGFIFYILTLPYEKVLLQCNKHILLMFNVVLQIILSVVLSIIGFKVAGLDGFVCGALLALILVGILRSMQVKRIFDLKLRKNRFLKIGIGLSLLWFSAHLVNVTALVSIKLAVFVVISLLLYFVFLYYVIMEDVEKTFLKKIGRSVFS